MNDYEIVNDQKSWCCDALVTASGYCTFCWEKV